ncbi:MAG: hypothetical protein ABSF35_06470 [Polyangia bacterium]|jgi:hypothetical protein
MTDIERVRLFLRQVRRRALLVLGLRAAGFTAAAMLTTVLLLGLTATWIGPATFWRAATILVLLALLLLGLAMLWGLPARRLRSMRSVAAFAGRRHPPLASDLLSAVELDVDDDRELPNAGSLAMARAFFATVADAAAPLDPARLLPLRKEVWAGLAAALAALLLVLAVALSPDTVGRGLHLLAHRPSRFEAASPSRDPLVADLRITYQYPAYTAMAPRVVEGSTGDIVALRGTRVLLEMRPLRSTRQALLLLGESGEGGEIPATVSAGKLSAGLVVNEDNSYRVWLSPLFGRPVRETRSHRIVVEPDRPPEVDIMAPADHLELAAPRPVEVGYSARDDYGLARIELVYRVDSGPEQRTLLKDAQGARAVRGTTLFEPTTAMLTPGARVAYHIEAHDRDDVSGSKLGASRTLTLVIQNPREALDEHLAAEHVVLDKLVGTLADRIEFAEAVSESPPLERLWRWRDLHEAEESHLVLLGRLVDEQRRKASASRTLVAALASVADRLGRQMREEADLLKGLRKQADQGALTSTRLNRLQPAGARHVAELESVVLVLDDLIGRQRLDDLAELGKELTDAHKRLQDLLARYQMAGDEGLRRQIEREIRELRARIAELARKIAEVKARNEVATDWMNMPDPKKAMEQAARLDSLLEKGDARSLAEALAELGNTLAALQQALDKNADDFSRERFPQESRALAEAMKKIGDLEGDQRGLASDSKALAQETEAAQARRMEAQLDDFLAKAKQSLDGMQRRIGGAPPREVGLSLGADLERARESVRQMRRQLPAKEWAEARKESERLASGLRRVQGTLAERGAGKPPSSSFDSYSAQIEEAGALAQDLAADLAKLVPRGDDALTPGQREQARGMGERQDSIGERTERLAQELDKRQGQVPGGDMASAELGGIAGQMRQASKDLRQGAAVEGSGRAQEAADRLAKLRESLGQRPMGSGRSAREPVRIPGADEYRAPREWREELMEAMREQAPEKFRDEVRRYYEELVR